MCVLNMHCICCAKNFEIKMCIKQAITMFLSEEVTSKSHHYLKINAEEILRTPGTCDTVSVLK